MALDGVAAAAKFIAFFSHKFGIDLKDIEQSVRRGTGQCSIAPADKSPVGCSIRAEFLLTPHRLHAENRVTLFPEITGFKDFGTCF